jgi:hypothetical protein
VVVFLLLLLGIAVLFLLLVQIQLTHQVAVFLLLGGLVHR